MDKQTLVHSYNRILLINRKGKNHRYLQQQMNLQTEGGKEALPKRVHIIRIHLWEVLELAEIIYGEKNPNSGGRCGEGGGID